MPNGMTSKQKARLQWALNMPAPKSTRAVWQAWVEARRRVQAALRGRDLHRGLAGAVFVEACREADRHIIINKDVT